MSANNKPINAWSSSLAESVTPCPCPPEVSEHIPYTDKAETDGDSFFCEFCELLQSNELVVGRAICLCDSTYGTCLQCHKAHFLVTELLCTGGYCNECHLQPEQVAFNDYSESRFIPLNLE